MTPKRHGPSGQREQARQIPWSVAERIRQVSTEGLGRWDATWELVAEPSDVFMDALYQWEQSGMPDDLDAVHRTAEALLDAWRGADTAFQVSRLADAPEAITEGAA